VYSDFSTPGSFFSSRKGSLPALDLGLSISLEVTVAKVRARCHGLLTLLVVLAVLLASESLRSRLISRNISEKSFADDGEVAAEDICDKG